MTTQIPDRFKFDDGLSGIRPIELASCPDLGVKDRLSRLVGWSTALYRGYVATWAVRDGVLWLVDFVGHLGKDRPTVGLDWLFPGSPDVVTADWVTTTIDAPRGECIYEDDYSFVAERHTLIRVEQGRVIAEETIDGTERARAASAVDNAREAENAALLARVAEERAKQIRGRGNT